MLRERNIRRVVFGDREFDTWYGNAAYFFPNEHTMPGYEYANKAALDPAFKRRKQSTAEEPRPDTPTTHPDTDLWIDKLYVCNFCFKYTVHGSEMASHRPKCPHRTPLPQVGKMHYRDDENHYVIRQVRGFRHPLFCQNLALFGKLFLEDKSVFYNVDNFDFYVLYGKDTLEKPQLRPTRRRAQAQTSTPEVSTTWLVPLGFFSKEVLSWETEVNLACICVFPIFQRRHLGSLLIEFLYELSKREYKQVVSGPEYPLSPFGKVTYLRFWSKKLAHTIHTHFQHLKLVSLDELSKSTLFCKEDILLTMDYMGLLAKDPQSDKIVLHLGNLRLWCNSTGCDPTTYRSMLKEDNLLI